MNGRFVDMTGQTFWGVEVLELSHIGDDHLAYWKCVCECGNLFVVAGAYLRKGNSKSCGCKKKQHLHTLMYKDITGQRFGSLVVRMDVGRTKNGKTLWECVCDCGNVIYVPAGDLRLGKSTTCGCGNSWKGELNPRWRGGICEDEYADIWNKKLRNFIRCLDDHKCRFPNCTYDDTKERTKLHVHHIDGNKKHCDTKNLVSLCHSHHCYIEANNPRAWCDYFYLITGGGAHG